MTTIEESYAKAIALSKQVHKKYTVPAWIREFLHDSSEGSVQAQPNYSYEEQIENNVKLYSMLLDIGFSLGQAQTARAILQGQTGLAATVFSILSTSLKVSGPEEAKKITQEILDIQKDVGAKEAPSMKYVEWAMTVLSPAVATLIVGDVENYIKTVGSILVAFYLIGRYDATAEDVPEAFDFDGLDNVLKGLEK